MLALASLARAALAKPPAERQNALATSAETTTGADTDNIQEGDQTTPDAGGKATGETGGEQTPETAGEPDGPGGHEDPAGNVDHQFEGQE